MRFPYRPFEVMPTPGQPSEIIYRPMVPVQVIGLRSRTGILALLDSGADETLLPGFLIDHIGVEINPAETAQFRGVGGQLVIASYGTVDLNLHKGRASYRWPAKVGFLEGMTVAVLGHGAFLQYFTVTLDSKQRHVMLTPNKTFPSKLA